LTVIVFHRVVLIKKETVILGTMPPELKLA
jgi:hypothetical protein